MDDPLQEEQLHGLGAASFDRTGTQRLLLGNLKCRWGPHVLIPADRDDQPSSTQHNPVLHTTAQEPQESGEILRDLACSFRRPYSIRREEEIVLCTSSNAISNGARHCRLPCERWRMLGKEELSICHSWSPRIHYSEYWRTFLLPRRHLTGHYSFK